MNNTIIGENIKTIRKDAKQNQTAFADAIGITQSTLSSYESGSTLPSLEVLYTIAEKYNVSTDWILGLSTKTQDINSVSDIADFFIRLNDIKEIRYELDIHSHLPNDIETDDEKWYAALIFYGNDHEHEHNATVCSFLESLEGNRSSFKSYFTDLESFEDWKESIVERYRRAVVSKKEYEKISFTERIKRRDKCMEQMYANKKNAD